MTLAYFPSHLAQAGALVICVLGVPFLLPPLIRGESPALEDWPRWRVRVLAAGMLTFLIGFVASSFVLSDEPPGGARGGHWGTEQDRIVFGVWLAFIFAIWVANVRRSLRYRRHR